ncbi:OPT oligopeptide transporter protein-domain-containing protein [Mycena maculata]|uniref:OPT oligopeptide transporter protein-domain-containing protein n=1 Tax=Mycena maculata TaxID=230809 RepID=A0AAD7IEB5_9AGAR|nr:OPT oligopeptide transporter protein-domain-containing protein [Mycena maculata]
MSLIYAVSGFEMNIGVFNELMYGYMLDVSGSSRHPLGQMAYRIVSGHVWYDIQTLIQDQKIGHYMHIPPRVVVFSHIYESVIGVAVDYGAMRWFLDTKIDYLRGNEKDPNGQWTGQDQSSYNTIGVQYALTGPQILYKPLPYGFLAGAVAPLLLWLLHQKFKGPKVHLWNTVIFFSSMAAFRGNISGALTVFFCGFVRNFWLFRYRYKFWNMWAYIASAAPSHSSRFWLPAHRLAHPRHPINFARQTDCTTPCTTLSNSLLPAQSGGLASICTSTVVNNYAACYGCEVQTGDLTQASAQETVDSFVSGCQAAGQAVSSVTISADGSTSGGSGGASGNSTAPIVASSSAEESSPAASGATPAASGSSGSPAAGSGGSSSAAAGAPAASGSSGSPPSAKTGGARRTPACLLGLAGSILIVSVAAW